MSPPEINGWTVYAHPLLLEQVDALISKVKRLQEKDPLGYRSKAATKRLAAIVKLAKNDIPQVLAAPQYRQGNTLGMSTPIGAGQRSTSSTGCSFATTLQAGSTSAPGSTTNPLSTLMTASRTLTLSSARCSGMVPIGKLE